MRKTFSYLKNHFWLPIAVMIVPSVVACFLSTPYWEVSFVAAFEDTKAPIIETFYIMFGDSWQYVWPVVVISICQIVGTTLIMAAVDKHFRTGKLSLRMPFRLVNNTIFPIALGVVVMCVFSILLRFAQFGIVSLIQVIGKAANIGNAATLTLISIFSVVLFFFHVLVITNILFWAPTMFIYGYRFRDAAATSFKMLSGKKVFRGMFLPLLVCAGVQMLVGFLGVPYAVECVVDFLVFLATNVFVPVFVMITFYEISGLDRRDLKPYENIPIPPLPKKSNSNKTDKTEEKDKSGEEESDVV